MGSGKYTLFHCHPDSFCSCSSSHHCQQNRLLGHNTNGKNQATTSYYQQNIYSSDQFTTCGVGAEPQQNRRPLVLISSQRPTANGQHSQGFHLHQSRGQTAKEGPRSFGTRTTPGAILQVAGISLLSFLLLCLPPSGCFWLCSAAWPPVGSCGRQVLHGFPQPLEKKETAGKIPSLSTFSYRVQGRGENYHIIQKFR